MSSLDLSSVIVLKLFAHIFQLYFYSSLPHLLVHVRMYYLNFILSKGVINIQSLLKKKTSKNKIYIMC